MASYEDIKLMDDYLAEIEAVCNETLKRTDSISDMIFPSIYNYYPYYHITKTKFNY